jgi:peptidoglycan/xylan/chitin deacetylase (PgdA/CDA1 family)/glycosyltransferase involved in cell wall biosynthesis
MTIGRSLFRWASQGRLTTLAFHQLPQAPHPLRPGETTLGDFEAILKATLRRFRILSLDDAVTRLRAGNLPPSSACITFDDGYAGWLRNVVPILERYGIPATFFVTVGQFNGTALWNERILNAVSTAPENTPPLAWATLPELLFNSLEERRRTARILENFLKYQDTDRRRSLIAALELHTGAVAHNLPTLSIEALKEIHARGFSIGAHTIHHPILSHCSEQSAFDEIAGAKRRLEELINDQVTAFAYPNGRTDKDFGPEHVAMVERAGYRYAVTTDPGVATQYTSLMRLPRFTPWGPGNLRTDVQLMRNLRQEGPHDSISKATHRRVLMVAFHFPPQSGSSGVLRTLNFVKHLPALGWHTSVLTAQPTAYEDQRNDLVPSITTQTRVIRARALDAARHLSVLGKYPRILALPDRWSWWWIDAVRKGLKEIRQTQPEVIWSTYPIATAHLIAATLAQISGRPWVADFRDPMVTDDYPNERLMRKVWVWLEGKVLAGASACVFTTAGAAQAYAARYQSQSGKCFVIENGYDEEVFEKAVPNRHGVSDETLLLLHSGLIYPKDRDPSTFFSAVRELLDDGTLNPERIRIRFRAPHHTEEVLLCAKLYDVERCVEIAPPVPYQDAIAEMLGADLLLVFQGTKFNRQVPAKIYEYIRTDRPILCIADKDGNTSRELTNIQKTYVSDIHSSEDIKLQLRNYLNINQLRDEEPSGFTVARKTIDHSRKSKAVTLSKLLNKVHKDCSASISR